jgi:hypothetical protein
MVSEPYTAFQHITSIGSSMLLNELENNMKTFLDWCFLNVGGFVNVVNPTESAFSGNFQTLRVADDPNYNDRQVFEGIRKDWVWETGVSYSGYSPIAISGVYVNGELFTISDPVYGHHYDYENGRVIFSGTVPANSGVSLNYSYRWVQTYVSDRAGWYYNGDYASLKPGDSQWTTYHPSSGDFARPPQHRVQFPAIVVESISKADSKPYQLGDSTLVVSQDVMFNIISNTRHTRNTLVDVLRMQEDRTIWLYDTDEIVQANLMPLDSSGMIANSQSTYPYLVDNYRFAKCFFSDIQISEMESLSPLLHEAKVRITMELILSQI